MKITSVLPLLALLLLGACGPPVYVQQPMMYNPCDPQYYNPYGCQQAIGMGGYYYGGTYYPLRGGHTYIYYQQQEQQFVAKGGRPKPVDATKLEFKNAPKSKDADSKQFQFTPKSAVAPAATPATPATPQSKFQFDKPAAKPATPTAAPAPKPAPAKSFSFTPSKRK